MTEVFKGVKGGGQWGTNPLIHQHQLVCVKETQIFFILPLNSQPPLAFPYHSLSVSHGGCVMRLCGDM